MNTSEILSRPEWREWHTSNPIDNEHASRRFQLTVKSEYQKLYFINLYEYDSRTIPNWPLPHKIAYHAEFRLFPKNAPTRCLGIELDPSEITIEGLEQYAAHLYALLDCQPDLDNN